MDVQNRLQVLNDQMRQLSYKYNWTYGSDKKEIENELAKLRAEYDYLQKNQIVYSGGNTVPVARESHSWNQFKNKKKKTELLEQQRMEQERIERERAALYRKQQFDAEQAELDAMITKTTLASNQRNLESMEKYERQKMDYFRDAQHYEEERRRRNEEEERKMKYDMLMEERRLAEEREKSRHESELRNAMWKDEMNRKNFEETLMTNRLRERNQHELDHLDQFNRERNEQRQSEIKQQTVQYAREREEQLEELRRLDEEVKRSQEECRRKYEEMERKSREQMEILLKLLERARWNRTIEANWDNRIRALKSTDRRIYRSMGQLRTQLVTAKIKEMNPEIIRRHIDGLKTETTEVKRVMDREVENLENFYKMSGKQFILDIQKSLLAVSDVLFSFIDYLDSQYSQNFNRESVSVFYNRLEEFEMDVTKVYREIPTLDRLKSKYRSSWDSSESSSSAYSYYSHVQAITEDDHVIRIEEID